MFKGEELFGYLRFEYHRGELSLSLIYSIIGVTIIWIFSIGGLFYIRYSILKPLNSIKLYGKALEMGMYNSKEREILVAKRIQEKTLEIDNFLSEIIRASSEDILEIDVKESEFYLSELMDKVLVGYGDRCSINGISFKVHEFEDNILRGSNSASKEGNGLGLYICKYIMGKMGGDVFCECEDGGMSFTVVVSME